MKKRNHNIRLLKGRRSYSVQDLTKKLGVHPRTVQLWRKKGLKPIDETSRPFLFMGSEIQRFLGEQRKKRRFKLAADEFYCPRCRVPKKSLPQELRAENTFKKLGRNALQIILRGICQSCGGNLVRFGSDKPSPAMKSEELPKGLIGSDGGSVNADISKGQVYEV